MSFNSSENIISLFNTANSAPVQPATHDDPLQELLTEFQDLSEEVEEEVAHFEEALPQMDLALLTDEQLFEFIESRMNRLQDLKKRLHFYGAELSQYIE